MHYDFVIVGGGTAGCVLANRLSAKGTCQVLLLEAGQDTPHGKIPADILDSYTGTTFFDPRFHWPRLKVRTEVVSSNNPGGDLPPLRRYEQARVLGGGSSINGQLANRGAPADFEEWVARGASGWGWKDVLPYYRKVETDMDFDGSLHGKDGRIPIRRIFPDLWTEHAKAAAEAFKTAGFKYLPDQNGEWTDGYYPIAISNAYERRVSAAIAYLDPTTRQRSNLTISTGTQVSELLFVGQRCTGVAAYINGTRIEFNAREVILSCGAIHSPAHLLRAGIGPVEHLRDLGIEIRAALPGVGRGLMDHPSISVSAYVKRHARMNEFTRRHVHVGLRYSSNMPGMQAGDMSVLAITKSTWHSVGERIASFLIAVYNTCSERGQVKLTSRDWHEEPLAEFNLLSDRRDLERLMSGFRKMGALYATPAMRAVSSDPFPASYSERVRKVGVVNSRNRILTGVAGALLDGPASLRSYLIRKVITEGYNFEQLMTDDEALESFVRRSTIGIWHASCSARMGGDGDPMAVTDTQGRVRGASGLRVVDASIFPVVPSANTNLPTLMLAEKIADAIQQSL